MEKEIRNSELYLRTLIGNKSGFKTPDSYFSEVEEKLSLQIVEDSLSETEGFDVPDKYFDSLEDRIFNKIDIEESKRKVIPLRKRIVQWIPAAAAAIALLFTLNFIDFGNNELTEDDIVNWFESDLESITNDDFILAFEDIDLSDYNVVSNTITDSSIEEYLDNQDVTSLLEELE